MQIKTPGSVPDLVTHNIYKYISTWSQHEIRFDPIYFYSIYTSLHPKNVMDKKLNIYRFFFCHSNERKKIFVIFHQNVITKTSYFSFGLVKSQIYAKRQKTRVVLTWNSCYWLNQLTCWSNCQCLHFVKSTYKQLWIHVASRVLSSSFQASFWTSVLLAIIRPTGH